jgi:NADH dehydrogenase [ubiquinone] 1 alpha subcomplex assembly factor 1|tara:strand:- start:631 stop:1191 length:561 start_codon:yes stop_codon:yes gene_type:complete
MMLHTRRNYIFILISLLFNTFIFAQNVTIIKPSENIGIDNWNIVNDGVMGGISQSSIYLNETNNIKFVGNVSLENNGGFASCRMGYNGSQLKGSTKFLLRVKGDGNIYKLRFRMNGSYANYSADFSTVKDEWVDIEIPIEDFKPYYFGRKTRAPRFKIHKINSIGILISDKQSGSFSLEVEHLKAL